jgi:protein AroM
MMRPRLGIVTIGQTPRPDLAAVFGAVAPDAVIDVRGALDAFSPADARLLEHPDASYPLLVRLRDDTTAEVPMSVIHPLAEAVAGRLVHDGAYAVVIACAGEFPAIPLPVPTVLPGRILPAMVRALTTERRIGVVAPIEAQLSAAEEKWKQDGFEPVLTWASPTNHHDIERATAAMRDARVSLVVLDCMGHDDDYTRNFEERVGCRVISAQSAAAHVAGTLRPTG